MKNKLPEIYFYEIRCCLICRLPAKEKNDQEIRLSGILGGLRQQERGDMCTEDHNIWDYLLSESFKHKDLYLCTTNVRSRANTICCFLMPLFKQLGIYFTSELLVPKYGDALLNRLMEFSGINEYNQNPEAFVHGLKQKPVIIFFAIFLKKIFVQIYHIVG